MGRREKREYLNVNSFSSEWCSFTLKCRGVIRNGVFPPVKVVVVQLVSRGVVIIVIVAPPFRSSCWACYLWVCAIGNSILQRHVLFYWRPTARWIIMGPILLDDWTELTQLIYWINYKLFPITGFYFAEVRAKQRMLCKINKLLNVFCFYTSKVMRRK